MRTIYSKFFLLLATLLVHGSALVAQASGGSGAEGESPYSSSTTEAPPNEDFLSSYGLVIFCLVVFVGLLLFVSLRGRTRT